MAVGIRQPVLAYLTNSKKDWESARKWCRSVADPAAGIRWHPEQ
jgi:hypothetical protein